MVPVASYAKQKVVVFGLGKSGLSAARALGAGGAAVKAWDDASERRDAAKAEGVPLDDPLALDWSKVAALVLSPGVPFTHPEPHPVVRRAVAAGVKILPEVELLQSAMPDAFYVGVTGTNGKSTTTALIGHLLNRQGYEVQVGGNIGTPALDLEPFAGRGTYVLELSSYQLDLARSLAFDVAVLLNVTPDHLDRHGDMSGYITAKRKIFRFRRPDGTAIIGVDDEYTRSVYEDLLARGDCRVLAISTTDSVADGVYVSDGLLHEAKDGGAAPVVNLAPAKGLPGQHNWQNAAAAFAAATALGVPSASAGGALISFPGLAHRIERIATIEGIAFVNDSKATNADAAAKALACFDHIYWIVGGRAKPGGVSGLEPLYPRIAHALLIGEAADEIAKTLEGNLPYRRCGTLDRAVAEAYALARAGRRPDPVVLLSPACASFDQFENFEARGEAFRREVQELEAAGGHGHSVPLRSAVP
ncbi:MAG: UDP-N-acetylmuramoyl-L-alanine--D-glutamate ligase [Alphaproteobacteria bacterium]